MGTIYTNSKHWRSLLQPQGGGGRLRRDFSGPVISDQREDPPEDVRAAARALMRAEARDGNYEALLLDADLDVVSFTPLGEESEEGLVSVLLPVRGAHDCLDRCLEALVAHTNSEDYELIVACWDEEREAVSALLRKHGCGTTATMVCSEEPMGFPRAINTAAHMASGSILLLLNSDAYVTPNWLGPLLRTLKANPHVAAVGPVSTNICGEEDTALLGKAMEEQPPERMHRTQAWVVEDEGLAMTAPPTIDEVRGAAREWKRMTWQKSLYTDALTAFCIAIHASAFWRAGGISEEFGLGNFDDNDLCLRLLMLHHRLVLNQRVLVLHQSSASFKELSQKSGDEGLYKRLLDENKGILHERWRWCQNEIRKMKKEAFRGPAL